MSALRQLLRTREFVAGIDAGSAALALVLAIAVLLPNARRRLRFPGLIGIWFVAASVVVIDGVGPFRQVHPVPTRVVLGLIALWIAGEVGARTPVPWLVGGVVAVAGGALLMGSHGAAPGWTSALLLLGPAVAGSCVADLDRRTARLGLAPLLLLAAIGGMYGTVPDTELPRVLLGVALPLAFLAWPRAVASLGAGGSYASMGLFLWVATIQGAGRPGSIVGAVGALGLLVGEPLGRVGASLLGRGPRTVTARHDAARMLLGVAVVTQVVLALYASRVAGLESSALTALELLLPAVVVALLFGAGLAFPAPAPRRSHSARAAPVDS